MALFKKIIPRGRAEGRSVKFYTPDVNFSLILHTYFKYFVCQGWRPPPVLSCQLPINRNSLVNILEPYVTASTNHY